MGQLVKTAC